jgi:hypothetical protein
MRNVFTTSPPTCKVIIITPVPVPEVFVPLIAAALHEKNLAKKEHTTLLLNCYTNMKDEKRLHQFLRVLHSFHYACTSDHAHLPCYL